MFDREVDATFDRRSALFLGGVAVLSAILLARMLQMQVFQHKKYKRLAARNSQRVKINLAERGKVMSRGGGALARDVPVYRIYIIPDEVEDMDYLISAVTDELKLKPREIERIYKTMKKQRGWQPALVKESTDWAQLAALQAMNIEGLHIERGFSRRYSLGPAGAQTIGFLGAPLQNNAAESDAQRSPFFQSGQTGLERAFESTLAGVAGREVLIVDAMGRVTGEDKTQGRQSIDGQNLNTTLIASVQEKLYELLEPNKSGCGVVINMDGDILAMASAPSFNANDFRGDESAELMAELIGNPLKPFLNKPIEGLYPPGSTFKIVVALAALEAGVVGSSEKIYCPGFWEYGNHRYHCWEKHGHGWMDMVGAMKHSCDIYFYQIALRTGIERIRDMAGTLGLGHRLLDVFPREMAGVTPDKAWKEKNVGSRWQHGDTIISGIGQGFVLANCLQLAVMMARTATNKEIMPRIIPDADDNPPQMLGLSRKNIDIVLKGLEMVTQEGGTAAAHAINVRGAKMGGKTGTSQVRSISKKERETGIRTNEQLPWELRNHGLFIGFAPIGNPKYFVSVITEHSGGSGPAARTAAGVMKECLKLHETKD